MTNLILVAIVDIKHEKSCSGARYVAWGVGLSWLNRHHVHSSMSLEYVNKLNICTQSSIYAFNKHFIMCNVIETC